MASKKIAEMSNEELLKSENMIKVVMYASIGLNALLLIAGTFLTIKNGFNALIVIPVSMIPIIVLNANNLKAIRKEKENKEPAIEPIIRSPR